MLFMHGACLLEQVKERLMEEAMEFRVVHCARAIAHRDVVSNRKTEEAAERTLH
jgi:hypothetical protein